MADLVTPPAIAITCPNCGVLWAATSGPDGLHVNTDLTIRCRRTMRLECKCGYRMPWSGPPMRGEQLQDSA